MVDVHAWFAKRPDRPKVATNPRISPGFICTVRTFAVKRIKLDFLFQHRTVYPKEEAAILLGYMLLFNTTWGKSTRIRVLWLQEVPAGALHCTRSRTGNPEF